MKIAKETLIGFVLGVAIIVYSIYSSTDNYTLFFSMPSFVMVFGGTLAATLISFKGNYVIIALKELLRVFALQDINNQKLYQEVESILGWARVIKQRGTVGLEKDLANKYTEDSFIKFGVELLITGYKGDELRKMLTNFAETTFERNIVPAHILRTMASFAPGFGMLGTLVGLVIMLDKLGNDPTQIGKGLSFALVTTFYGVIFAQFVFRPSAEKVKQKQEILRYRNLLITEGFVLLAENREGLLIQDMLNSFLDPSLHISILKK